jgi:hypothetical protein
MGVGINLSRMGLSVCKFFILIFHPMKCKEIAICKLNGNICIRSCTTGLNWNAVNKDCDN